MRKPVLPYANNEGADQPAHPHSLINAFVVRCLDSIIPLVSISESSNLYLSSVGQFQSTLAENPEATRLIYKLARSNSRFYRINNLPSLNFIQMFPLPLFPFFLSFFLTGPGKRQISAHPTPGYY